MTDNNLGTVLANRYRVDLLLANNEFAPLYRGLNTVVERPMLIRILLPEHRDLGTQMLDEARDISRISNPNVLSVTDLGTEADGTVYVVYEDFDGETLSSAMSRDGKMPVAEAVGIATQIAEGAAAVAAVRNTHGAIAPDNVLVSDILAGPRRVKIFNLSSPETYNNAASAFSAPEIMDGVPANERSDVYSLAAMLYTMLAGEPPFGPSGESLEELPPPPLSSFRTDLPPDLEPVMLTALARNPEIRYQTITEFAQQLDRVSQAPVAAAAQGNNNLWKTAFIVLAGIAILAAALIYATSVKQTDPKTQLQPDANGLPVQPINPATGAQEQALANMAGMPAEVIANSNMAMPGTVPGGDGYDPWKNGGQPPAGAPNIGPGGQVITIDPNSPSQFMPAEGCVMQPSGILLCPAPLNANAAKKPTPTPKNNANANVQASPTPKTTPETKPTPAAEKTPAKPATQKTPTAKPSPGKSGDNN